MSYWIVGRQVECPNVCEHGWKYCSNIQMNRPYKVLTMDENG